MTAGAPGARRRLPAAVVFDFDGVLIESTKIKTEAFTELFAEYPEHHAAIARHHQENLGISRFEKFDWICRELLHRDLGAAESLELGRRFSDLVFERAAGCPAVPGAVDTLESLHASGVPLFIASGTPQEELDRLIEARCWGSFFRQIHGSPRSKPDILRGIARSLAAAPEHLVFVGDGRSDLAAAAATGASFILRETAAQAGYFSDFEGPRVADLRNLAPRLTGG